MSIQLPRLSDGMGMDGAAKLSAHAANAVTTDADTLEEARLGFSRTHPRRSARRVFHFTQLLAIGALFYGATWVARVAPTATFTVAHIAALVIFSAAIFIRVIAAAQLAPFLSRLASPARFPIYTILCPLYREANVAHDLVSALACIDYPREALDIKLLVESDDSETIDASCAAAASTPHIEVIIVPACAPRTKPKALNVGLARARGEFVVIYDAEDRPHAQQLNAALAAFEDGEPDLACVQAPLVIDNADASWISRQFAAEYAIQFREMLPLLALLKLPLPLGGTSNHFRTDVLRRCGGWDAYNVSEDRANFASKLNR
ncbi:MAG: glycosyltransferase, partial [Hyphomonadaceae bacterium]|nr:glycosyltransferase [Hyphomonadaceae bacterium]